jgi:RimJ/RimL family protein N-acetyltransferase
LVATSEDRDANFIQTNRLELHLISVPELLALAADPTDPKVIAGKPFVNPYKVLEQEPSPVRYRAPQVEINPAVNKWFIRWIVEKSTREIVGSISFHGPPDDEGMLEVGLGICTEKQNLGYAKEALFALWSWALSQSGVHKFRYTVSADNYASVAVINFFEFLHVGQQIDEEDGPEEIYEMSCKTFADKLNTFQSKLQL